MKQITDTPAVIRPRFLLSARSRWWAAAAVVFVLSTLSYFLFFNRTTRPEQVAKTLPNDVKAPQSNRAMITLANGQKIYLDSTDNGALVMQGNIEIVKLETGEIAYQQNSHMDGEKIQYNTLSNPRGSKVINMILADGSKVWLNAGSELIFPVAFVGNERKVSINGEGYFEVSHNASKTFVVNNGSMDVRVLGTRFNVNTFEDEDQEIKVTLLEGAVKINNGAADRLLKPGQQALVDKDIKVVDDVDLGFVMAWKNGYFQFNNASLQNVLKQVSRWYDVEVVYEGNNKPRQFVGEVQMDLDLAEMLKILDNNNVHFRIEGKRLIVMPD